MIHRSAIIVAAAAAVLMWGPAEAESDNHRHKDKHRHQHGVEHNHRNKHSHKNERRRRHRHKHGIELTDEQKALKAEFEQIDEGFRVFTEETFEGNGRTCATCHIPSEAYNIFPETIKKLSRKEKALVFAKNVPGLENPTLVKKRALFNVAGGPDSDARDPGLFNSCGEHPHDCAIFRSTMGIFGLDVTTENLRNKGTPLAPAHCSTRDVAPGLPQLGWSGDGSPGTPVDDIACRTHHGNEDVLADGSIMAFANGAIAQHAPKSVRRLAKHTACGLTAEEAKDAHCHEDYDFRFATLEEAAAMAVFQKWLGRRTLSQAEIDAGAAPGNGVTSEFDIAKLDFKDPRINMAVRHFNGGGQFVVPNPGAPSPIGGDTNQPVEQAAFGAGCSGCHTNAGSRAGFPGGPAFGDPSGAPPNFPPGGNININTDVELASARIGDELFGVPLPHDEGAAAPFGPGPLNINNLEQFNLQSIIEAARKKAWFHNHRAIQVTRKHHKGRRHHKGRHHHERHGKSKVIKGFEDAIAFYASDDFTQPDGNNAAVFTNLEGMNFGDGVTADFPDGNGIDHLGAFLRSLSAYYGLRNCERLVNEAIERIGVYVSPKLAVQHCQFELADVKRVLEESKLEPKPYRYVAGKASKLSRYLEKAADRRDVSDLERVIDALRELRTSIAVVAPPAP